MYVWKEGLPAEIKGMQGSQVLFSGVILEDFLINSSAEIAVYVLQVRI